MPVFAQCPSHDHSSSSSFAAAAASKLDAVQCVRINSMAWLRCNERNSMTHSNAAYQSERRQVIELICSPHRVLDPCTLTNYARQRCLLETGGASRGRKAIHATRMCRFVSSLEEARLHQSGFVACSTVILSCIRQPCQKGCARQANRFSLPWLPSCRSLHRASSVATCHFGCIYPLHRYPCVLIIFCLQAKLLYTFLFSSLQQIAQL